MFSSYLHDKRLQSASHSSKQRLLPHEVLRNQLALRYKRRLDQELVKVRSTQLALSATPKPSTEQKERHAEPRFRVRGHRTTLERLNQTAQETELIDTSASHTPVFLLRPRRKELELGQPIRFRTKTQTERLAEELQRQYGYAPQPQCLPRDVRTVSAGRGLLPTYHSKTHYKTILSLEMSLHSWQRGPQERDIRDRIRLEKTGHSAENGQPTLLKHPMECGSLIDNIRIAPSAENLVLTNEQKSQLSQEILRSNEVIPARNHSPLRSRGGASPTTFCGEFSRAQSFSMSRKAPGERTKGTEGGREGR